MEALLYAFSSVAIFYEAVERGTYKNGNMTEQYKIYSTIGLPKPRHLQCSRIPIQKLTVQKALCKHSSR